MSEKPKSLPSARRRRGAYRQERNQSNREKFGVLLVTGNEILRVGLRSMIEQCGFRVYDCPVSDQGFIFDGLTVQKCRIFVIDASQDVEFSRTKEFVAQIRERNARGHIVALVPPHLAHAIDPAVVVDASAIVTTEVTAHVLGNLLQLVARNYVIRSADVAIAPHPVKIALIDGPVPPLCPDPLPPLDGRTFTGLSTRESETLLHVIRGSSNKVIARALGIAEATVKIHVKGIFRKIGVANRTQAAFYAFNQGWLAGEAASPQEVEPEPAPKANCFPTGLDIIVPRAVLR